MMSEKFEYIEGLRPCFEALEHNVPVMEILVGNYINLKSNNSIEKLLTRAKSQGLKISKVDKSFLDKASVRGSHQGIMAKVEPFKYTDLKEILQNCENKSKALIAVLDHIEDAGNLGAIARSAEAFGADGMIIANKRAASVSASTYKSSAGAVCHLPIAMVANISTAIDQLKDNDFWIASATEHADKNIWDENLKGKIAIVMGSEHDGISSLVLKNSDFKVRLPLSGDTESLNVAQAFTACAYEWVRQNS